MFTGIIQSKATVIAIQDQEGLRTITIKLEESCSHDLKIGASISIDGVCLTITALKPGTQVDFDIILQSLNVTTLDTLRVGSQVNIERAAHQGAEIGGHTLSGHIDCCGRIMAITEPRNNYVLRIQVPKNFLNYIFAKGYIALHGASLTVSEVNRQEGWFEVWLIPETLRATTLGDKKIGEELHIEIERTTQIMVDTIYRAVQETLGLLSLP